MKRGDLGKLDGVKKVVFRDNLWRSGTRFRWSPEHSAMGLGWRGLRNFFFLFWVFKRTCPFLS
ncbi:MAG: hypothetical protein CMO55_25410 [Verrucomicrobiales bacterium]|nr:hypothetical protein [Verrucomicrobiales bacterium]